VIVVGSSLYADAAGRATSTVPIVFAIHGDPVGAGHAVSLARPGKNLTGLAQLVPEVNAKGLELLKEAVPSLSAIAVLAEPANPSNALALKRLEERGAKLGLNIISIRISAAAELDEAVAAAARSGAKALLVISGSVAFVARQRLADLALSHRLPTMFTQ